MLIKNRHSVNLQVLKNRLFRLSVIGFTACLCVSVIVAEAPLANAMTVATTGYVLDTPLPIADWYIGKYSDGSYFAINGSNWDNLVAGVGSTAWSVYKNNATKLTELVLGEVTSGTVYLKEVAFDLALMNSIPENVKVACSYQDQYEEFINPLDTTGSPYQIEVGQGVTVDNYIARDSQNRICFTSTNFTSVYDNIIASSPASAFRDSSLEMHVGVTASIFIKSGFYSYDTTLNIPTSSNIQIIGEQNSAWEVQRLTNSTIYYGGVTLYYTGNDGKAIELLPRGIYPSTQFYLKHLELRVHDNGTHNSNSAVNLAGMFSGEIEDVNICSDNLPDGSAGKFNNDVGLNMLISASSDNKLVRNVKVFGFHTKGCIFATPHLTVEKVVAGLVIGYTNARAFDIRPGEDSSFKDLHTYYSKYGVSISNYAGIYPLIIDGVHFETVDFPYVRFGGSGIAILQNPVLEMTSDFIGDITNASICKLVNAVIKDTTTIWTNRNTTTLTNVDDGAVIPIGLGGINTVPAWVTVQSQNSTAIIASVTAWDATTATVSLKDITGASVTGQTITLSYGRYLDS